VERGFGAGTRGDKARGKIRNERKDVAQGKNG